MVLSFWHDLATRKTVAEVAIKQKEILQWWFFCLVNDIATSQWYQLSGVWHFDLHLPALKTTELSVGLRLSQPRNQKLTKRQDHKSDERCHLLTIKSKPSLQFAARKYRLHDILISRNQVACL